MGAGSHTVKQELQLLLMVNTQSPQYFIQDNLILMSLPIGIRTVPAPGSTGRDQDPTLHTVVPRTVPLAPGHGLLPHTERVVHLGAHPQVTLQQGASLRTSVTSILPHLGIPAKKKWYDPS